MCCVDRLNPQSTAAIRGQLQVSRSRCDESRQQKVEKLAELLKQFGYEARSTAAGAPTIEASNCIFHSLAVRNPEVCQFDLALLSTFTDSKVDHQECMARGGNVCRFKFVPRR